MFSGRRWHQRWGGGELCRSEHWTWCHPIDHNMGAHRLPHQGLLPFIFIATRRIQARHMAAQW